MKILKWKVVKLWKLVMFDCFFVRMCSLNCLMGVFFKIVLKNVVIMVMLKLFL